jgi:hypothetical protein
MTKTQFRPQLSSLFSSLFSKGKTLAVLLGVTVLAACDSGSSSSTANPVTVTQPTPTPPAPLVFVAQQGTDLSISARALLSANPGGPGGSSNQSLRSGDAITGTAGNDILIGGLGVDVLRGMAGNDIMIGGTEDFSGNIDGGTTGSDNRDRAYGGDGADVFIWSPGDGSDTFNGGAGVDVLIFGVLGEAADADGLTAGAPFFNVNPPSGAGSQDFDGIFLDANSQPRVRSSNSPGFCSIVDAVANRDQLESLNLNQIVRFSLRGVANAFDDGTRTDDDGLRVAISTSNVEFVVCTTREFDETAGLDNVEVFDISGEVPVAAEISSLPLYVQDLII